MFQKIPPHASCPYFHHLASCSARICSTSKDVRVSMFRLASHLLASRYPPQKKLLKGNIRVSRVPRLPCFCALRSKHAPPIWNFNLHAKKNGWRFGHGTFKTGNAIAPYPLYIQIVIQAKVARNLLLLNLYRKSVQKCIAAWISAYNN